MPDGARDYVVRRSDIKTDGSAGLIFEGQRVEFTAGTGDDGKPVALDGGEATTKNASKKEVMY